MRTLYIAVSICFVCFIQVSCNKETNPADKEAINAINKSLSLAQELIYTNPDTALILTRNALDLSKQINYKPGLGESSLIIGKIFFDLGSISQANIELNKALAQFIELEDKERIASIYTLISKVYQRSENYQHAFDYLRHALGEYEEINHLAGLAEAYGDIGHVFEKTQQYDSALFYQSKALNYYVNNNDTLGLAAIHDNMGSIYEDLENYEKAYLHFNMAFVLNESINNRVTATINLNNIGDIYRKQGDLGQALRYTQEALQYARKTHQDYQVKSAYRDLSKTYFQMGDLEKAFAYLEKSYDLTDSLFSEVIAEEIAKTQTAFELQRKQERIQLLEANQEANQLVAFISILGGIAIALFGSLLFFQQRAKNKKARKLLEAKAELARIELKNSQLSEQNLKSTLENKLLREHQLKNELELKSRSLTNSTLHLIQKNEFLDLLKGKLSKFKNTKDPSLNRTVRQLIRSIDLNFNVDDDWREFEKVFQQVHNDFLKSLTKCYPDLSPAELRLCAMIRLNLHSKEMAAIMGITQDSLRTSRYRLRKRLGINQGENLYGYIRNIG